MSDARELAQLGVPEGFGMAEGCRHTPPAMTHSNNTFEDFMYRTQQRTLHYGHADWMGWTDELTGNE